MWWISFICFILCFSTSSDFILSLFSFISSFQLLLLLSWRLSVCAWRGRQVRPRLAVSASVFPHKTSTSRPAGCSRQVHTHLDIWPHKIPLFSIVLSFPLKFHTRHSLLCSDWLDHKEALILIKMQLLLPRLFLKPTSCFVVLPHMSLKHCLILRWCSWLARLQLFLLLFFFCMHILFIWNPTAYDCHHWSWLWSKRFVIVNVCMSVSLALWKRRPRRSTRFRWTQTYGLGLTSGRAFKERSRPQWPLFQRKASMSESRVLLLVDLYIFILFVLWFLIVSLYKTDRWAVQLGVGAAGVEGRHKESHVSCFRLLHTGRMMFILLKL